MLPTLRLFLSDQRFELPMNVIHEMQNPAIVSVKLILEFGAVANWKVQSEGRGPLDLPLRLPMKTLSFHTLIQKITVCGAEVAEASGEIGSVCCRQRRRSRSSL